MDDKPQGNSWMNSVLKSKKGVLGVAIVAGMAAGAAYHFMYGSKAIKECPYISLDGGEEERHSLDPQSDSGSGSTKSSDNNSPSTSSGELKSNTPTSSKDSSHKKK